MIEENRDVTFDANNNEIIAGTPVICIDDSLGGDNDTLADWDFVKGNKYIVERVFDSENLITPMVVICGSKNGPVLASRFTVINPKANVVSTVSYPDTCKTIFEALTKLTPQEVCDLKNSLVEHEVSILNNKGQIDNYSFADIEAWAIHNKVSITESDDVITHQFNYWIGETPSDISFETEREALISAFTSFITP